MARIKIVETLRIQRLLRRLPILLFSITLLLAVQWSLPVPTLVAQAPPASAGSPPTAALITVSPPNINGIVTVSGAPGSVPPIFQVAVRNLYTEQIVYTNAGGNGSFSVNLFANGSTPFWISAARDIPTRLRELPGWMPGGPGTIVYSTVSISPESNVTQLTMDGDIGDWSAYPEAELDEDGILALRNQDSLYLALENDAFAPDVTEIILTFGFDDNSAFEVALNPTSLRSAAVQQLRQINLDRGAYRVNLAVLDSVVEVRIPLEIAVGVTTGSTRLLGIAVTNAEGVVTLNQTYELAIPPVEEVDGPVSPVERLETDVEPFYVAGAVAQGASYWYATGHINTLEIEPGAMLSVEMDVTLVAPDLLAEIVDLSFVGDIRLQPVTASARQANNGWSSLQTPSGLAIDNLAPELPSPEDSG